MPDLVRAAVLTGYPELARRIGLDPLQMIDAAGIPRLALRDLDFRISGSAARDLLEQSAHGVEDFALQLSEMQTPSILGPVLLIAREQPTVRGVVEAILRHIGLHSEATAMEIEDTADVSTIRMFQNFSAPGPQRQAVELGLAQLTRVLRLYLGPTWRPLSASFVHAPPKVLDTHHRLFGPNLRFNQTFNGPTCHRADLDRPNPSADPEMARQVGQILGQLGGMGAGLPERTRELVVGWLPSGKCTGEWVAGQLGVDLRTLQRQLAAAGTTFLEIVQGVRMSLVPQYLDQSDRPLAEVAELLGFSALSAFSRWHRQHYGVSASERRGAARTALPGG